MTYASHNGLVVRETEDEFGVDLACECGWLCHLRHNGNAKEYIEFHIALVQIHNLEEYDAPVAFDYERNPCGELVMPKQNGQQCDECGMFNGHVSQCPESGPGWA